MIWWPSSAARAGRAAVDPAADDDPAADAGADVNITRQLGDRLEVVVVGLGERGDGRVVVDEDRDAEALGEELAQRHVLQRDVHRRARGAGREVDDRRDADADGVGRARLLDQRRRAGRPARRSSTSRSGAARGSESVVPSSAATETFVPPTSTPMNRLPLPAEPYAAAGTVVQSHDRRDEELVERARAGDEDGVRRARAALLAAAAAPRAHVRPDAGGRRGGRAGDVARRPARASTASRGARR